MLQVSLQTSWNGNVVPFTLGLRVVKEAPTLINSNTISSHHTIRIGIVLPNSLGPGMVKKFVECSAIRVFLEIPASLA